MKQEQSEHDAFLDARQSALQALLAVAAKIQAYQAFVNALSDGDSSDGDSEAFAGEYYDTAYCWSDELYDAAADFIEADKAMMLSSWAETEVEPVPAEL